MASLVEKESMQLQEIDVELIISSKVYVNRTAQILELKDIASKEFKQYRHGHDFDYFVTNHQLNAEENYNLIESLACYNTNKIILKPATNYKNQYEEFRKTIEASGKG